MFQNILRIVPYILISSCAVEAEKERPGVCPLNCGSAIIGSNDITFQIKPLNPITNITCDPDLPSRVPLARPVNIQFLISEKYKIGEQENFRPVPNISFEPLLTGEIYSEGTPQENLVKGDLPTEMYLGIRTSKYDWCSNSCGVMSIEFVPYCLPAGSNNNVNLFIHSGGLISEGVAIEIASPKTL